MKKYFIKFFECTLHVHKEQIKVLNQENDLKIVLENELKAGYI